MRDLNSLTHFQPLEQLTEILMAKAQNKNPLFFRLLTAYYFTKVASTMRVDIHTHDRGTIPINMYAINLAVSGSGKGYSTNIVEEQVIDRFKEIFLESTYPKITNERLNMLAVKKAIKEGKDPDVVIEEIEKDFAALGSFVFSFDSGTTPAVKQIRQKLLMGGIGSINLEIDEIGSNLISNIEVLNTFLELFDIGKVKPKLLKNTADNKRYDDYDGRTPTNMMLFGTPSKLLSPGSKSEEEFLSMLSAGYARRCFFGISKHVYSQNNITPEELYKKSTDPATGAFLDKLSKDLGRLADPIYFGLTISMSRKVALLFTEYQLLCRNRALGVSEYEEARKAELLHRFYKTMKLAGTYAFIDRSTEITEDHAYAAIKLAEESGEAFNCILKREKAHEALAKYIVDYDGELTVVDLMDTLPFFKGTDSVRKDLITRAIAYGYKNNILIKRSLIDNIELFSGETLVATDLNKLIVSYSKSISTEFKGDYAPISLFHKLIKKQGYHYCAHHFSAGHRHSDNLIPGFNLVILDIDKGVSLEVARMLLQDYTAIFATTKRHTDAENRFRIILPISHVIKLDAEQYSAFMTNVFAWLPFTVDTAAKDCARKWETHNGNYYLQEGVLLNALQFIPNTKAQELANKRIQENADLDNLERWFLLNIDAGNRNNYLLRYALALVDKGCDLIEIKATVYAFNKRLPYPLAENEINSTILNTVQKKIAKKP